MLAFHSLLFCRRFMVICLDKNNPLFQIKTPNNLVEIGTIVPKVLTIH